MAGRTPGHGVMTIVWISRVGRTGSIYRLFSASSAGWNYLVGLSPAPPRGHRPVMDISLGPKVLNENGLLITTVLTWAHPVSG